MLNTSPLGPLPQPVAGATGGKPGVSLRELVDFPRRNWRTIAVAILASLVLASVYATLSPPVYTAKTQLIIDSRKVQPFTQQAIVSDLMLDATVVDSQVELIRSDAVRHSVVQSLDLLKDPEFTAGSGGPFASARAAVGMLFAGEPAVPEPSEEELMERALLQLQRNIAVLRVGRTYVLEISYKSLGREKAAAIANAVADAYIASQLEINVDATRRAGDWLEDRLSELRDEVVKADRAVQDYIRENNLLEVGPGGPLVEQQLSYLNTQLMQAQGQVAEAKARLDRIQSLGEEDVGNPAVTDSLSNPVITKIRDQYLAAVQQEASISARYGPAHSALVDLRREIENLRSAGRDELRRIAEAYRSDWEIAKSRQQALEASLKEVTSAATIGRQAGVSLRMLESSAQSYRRLYDSFLQRFVDSTQQQSFLRTDARVIKRARTGEKSSPRATLTLGAALIFGVMAGVGLAFAREHLSRGLRTPRQLEDLLGTECLGIVPEVHSRTLRRSRPGAPADDPKSARCLPVQPGLERYSLHEPFSSFSETLRRVKAALDEAHSGSSVAGIISVLQAEGKSTIAINLAHLLAKSGNRTLLIDADARDPALTRRIAPEARNGLVEVLRGSLKPEDAIWQDPVSNLCFLPMVLDRLDEDTTGLLPSAVMETLLSDLRSSYRYILLDLPPLAPVVDARAAGHAIDAFVLVVEWGRTSPDAIEETLSPTNVVRSRLLGTVFNRVDMRALRSIEPHKGVRYYQYPVKPLKPARGLARRSWFRNG